MDYRSKIKRWAMSLLRADEWFPDPLYINDVIVFDEVWPSTALGYDGIGGSAMTTACTVVVFYKNEARVFWNGKYAYMVKPDENGKYSEVFLDDVYNKRITATVHEAKTRYA